MVIIGNGEETAGEHGGRLPRHVADASRGGEVGCVEEICQADHQEEFEPLWRSLGEADGPGTIPRLHLLDFLRNDIQGIIP